MQQSNYFQQWAICLLFLAPISLFSQHLEGGLLLGFNNYSGDFMPAHVDLAESHISYGVFLRAQFHKNISVRANFLAGKISGDDYNYAINEKRGYSFETTLLEGSAQLEWNIFVKAFKDAEGNILKTFQPYVFAGIGAVAFEPMMSGISNNDPDFNTSHGPVQAVFPLGAGLQWQYANGLSLGLELGARATSSDHLDGISVWGNSEKNDWYAFAGLSLGFLLN